MSALWNKICKAFRNQMLSEQRSWDASYSLMALEGYSAAEIRIELGSRPEPKKHLSKTLKSCYYSFTFC